MKIELRPGRTYLEPKGQQVTFIGLEQQKVLFLKRIVARVIPQTGFNPVEGEPVKAKFVNPSKLREIPSEGI